MLQKIRSNLQGIVAYIIIGFLVLVFALWGVEALFMDPGGPDVAEVNGEGISEIELNQQLYRQRQALIARMGEQGDPSQIDDVMLKGAVLQNMIQQRLLEQAAQERDLVIPEQMINQLIQQQPEFQVNGTFSPDQFNAMVRSNSMTPALYRAAMVNQVLVNQLLSGLALTEFVTGTEIEQTAAITGQKRDFEYVILGAELVQDAVKLEEGEVRAYFEQHPEEFQTEELVSVEYIELTLQDYYPDVSEDELRAAYDASIVDPQSATRRRAAHILLESGDARSEQEAEAKLLELATQIEGGAEFSALAQEYSEDLGSRELGGDLGYSDGSAFPEAFEAALAGLEPGQVSSPIRTDAGWHLVRLVELEANEVPSFAERREELLKQMQLEKAEPVFAVKLEELKDISFNAADLKSVADALGLEVEVSVMFAREGADQGLFADQRLISEAFSQAVIEQGANSEVVEIGSGQAVVLRLAERRTPELRPFDELASELETRLLKEKASAILMERAEAVRAGVDGGRDLKEIAESESLEYEQKNAISRDSRSEVEPEVAMVAFRLSPPADGIKVAVESLSDGRVLVLALNEVTPGTLDELDEQRREEIKRLLGRYRSERAVAGFRKSLQEGADIEIL